jgi:hypothetical protein
MSIAGSQPLNKAQDEDGLTADNDIGSETEERKDNMSSRTPSSIDDFEEAEVVSINHHIQRRADVWQYGAFILSFEAIMAKSRTAHQ